MRRMYVLGLIALYLGFSLVAGFAHVHGMDHHGTTHRLHVDHVHFGHGHAGDSGGHGPRGAQPQSNRAGGEVERGPDGHHAGDALYLGQAALRPLLLFASVGPAVVSSGPEIAEHDLVSVIGRLASVPPRASPGHQPPSSRAPPA